MPLILFILSLNVSAANLANFTPGTYDLTEGSPDNCGLGPMEYTQKNKYVALSAFHILPTENHTEVFDADIPEEKEKGCKYKASSSRKTDKQTTTLNFEEIKTCGAVEYHKLTKTAIVTREQVVLDVAQKGSEQEPSYGFKCIWKLRGAARRGGASTEEPKKTP